jgi:hypothetical protein
MTNVFGVPSDPFNTRSRPILTHNQIAAATKPATPAKGSIWDNFKPGARIDTNQWKRTPDVVDERRLDAEIMRTDHHWVWEDPELVQKTDRARYGKWVRNAPGAPMGRLPWNVPRPEGKPPKNAPKRRR